jgi:hypothetical protein
MAWWEWSEVMGIELHSQKIRTQRAIELFTMLSCHCVLMLTHSLRCVLAMCPTRPVSQAPANLQFCSRLRRLNGPHYINHGELTDNGDRRCLRPRRDGD